MPALSDKKLEMADINDVHALMLSQQVTTHMIRQKTAPLKQNPTRHVAMIRRRAEFLLLVAQGGV